MKASAPDAESLRDEEAAQIRASHRLFVAADELRDFERGHESIGQPAVSGRPSAGSCVPLTVCSDSE